MQPCTVDHCCYVVIWGTLKSPRGFFSPHQHDKYASGSCLLQGRHSGSVTSSSNEQVLCGRTCKVEKLMALQICGSHSGCTSQDSSRGTQIIQDMSLIYCRHSGRQDRTLICCVSEDKSYTSELKAIFVCTMFMGSFSLC